MVPLNYNQLYYFYKIAEQGSIAQASQKILISSPALSMQLKELEESLGTALFLRAGKKLVLTEAGSIVFEYAKDIFKLGFELRDTLGDRENEKERLKIEIGCQDSIPKSIADELLAFLIKSKKCKVVLREGNLERLIQMQNDYRLDLVLSNSIPAVDNEYIYENKLLLSENLIVVGHPAFKKFKGKSLSSFVEVPFILPTFDSSTRQKVENYFREKDLVLDVVAEVEDKATEIDLALRGLGLIIVLKSSVEPLLKQNMLLELAPLPEMKEEIWMLIGKRKILNPLALYAMKNFSLT
jgi:LysR family transcriptional regulator, transcriptional activator of nhaA